MGWDALGLVELRRDNMWSGAINAEPIITHRNYAMYANLFGILNSWQLYQPIIGIRGMPPDASRELIEKFREVKDNGLMTDKIQLTWITWREIEAVDWDESNGKVDIETGSPRYRREARSEEWNLLFDLMRILADNYGDDNVRLIVWFIH